jgi:hypothetical protein
MSEPSLRPALLSLQPERLSHALQAVGIRPRALALQPAGRQPERGRWQLLPAINAPLLIDCAGQGVITSAMLLTDLAREPITAPIFVVPRQALAIQRLLATSGLQGLVVVADLPPALIGQCLAQQLVPLHGLVWLGLEPPLPPSRSTYLVPLLAALAHAETVPQAAGWCDLSSRRAYEILADSAQRLQLPSVPRRHARQWAGAFNRALSGDEHQQARETNMEHHPLEIIAANLCGCVIERIRAHDKVVTFDLDEPRQGRLILTCADAEILSPPEEYADLAERSVWQRRIDWADIVAEDVIGIYLANECHLLLRLRGGCFTQDTGNRCRLQPELPNGGVSRAAPS